MTRLGTRDTHTTLSSSHVTPGQVHGSLLASHGVSHVLPAPVASKMLVNASVCGRGVGEPGWRSRNTIPTAKRARER